MFRNSLNDKEYQTWEDSLLIEVQNRKVGQRKGQKPQPAQRTNKSKMPISSRSEFRRWDEIWSDEDSEGEVNSECEHNRTDAMTKIDDISKDKSSQKQYGYKTKSSRYSHEEIQLMKEIERKVQMERNGIKGNTDYLEKRSLDRNGDTYNTFMYHHSRSGYKDSYQNSTSELNEICGARRSEVQNSAVEMRERYASRDHVDNNSEAGVNYRDNADNYKEHDDNVRVSDPHLQPGNRNIAKDVLEKRHQALVKQYSSTVKNQECTSSRARNDIPLHVYEEKHQFNQKQKPILLINRDFIKDELPICHYQEKANSGDTLRQNENTGYPNKLPEMNKQQIEHHIRKRYHDELSSDRPMKKCRFQDANKFEPFDMKKRSCTVEVTVSKASHMLYKSSDDKERTPLVETHKDVSQHENHREGMTEPHNLSPHVDNANSSKCLSVMENISSRIKSCRAAAERKERQKQNFGKLRNMTEAFVHHDDSTEPHILKENDSSGIPSNEEMQVKRTIRRVTVTNRKNVFQDVARQEPFTELKRRLGKDNPVLEEKGFNSNFDNKSSDEFEAKVLQAHQTRIINVVKGSTLKNCGKANSELKPEQPSQKRRCVEPMQYIVSNINNLETFGQSVSQQTRIMGKKATLPTRITQSGITHMSDIKKPNDLSIKKENALRQLNVKKPYMPKTEANKSNNANNLCPVNGCSASEIKNLKKHAFDVHFPAILRDTILGEPKAFGLDVILEVLKQVAAWILKGNAALDGLVRFFNQGKKLPSIDITESSNDMRIFCLHNGWTTPTSFSTKPINSIAVLTHWHVLLYCVNYLSENQRIKFRKFTMQNKNIAAKAKCDFFLMKEQSVNISETKKGKTNIAADGINLTELGRGKSSSHENVNAFESIKSNVNIRGRRNSAKENHFINKDSNNGETMGNINQVNEDDTESTVLKNKGDDQTRCLPGNERPVSVREKKCKILNRRNCVKTDLQISRSKRSGLLPTSPTTKPMVVFVNVTVDQDNVDDNVCSVKTLQNKNENNTTCLTSQRNKNVISLGSSSKVIDSVKGDIDKGNTKEMSTIVDNDSHLLDNNLKRASDAKICNALGAIPTAMQKTETIDQNEAEGVKTAEYKNEQDSNGNHGEGKVMSKENAKGGLFFKKGISEVQNVLNESHNQHEHRVKESTEADDETSAQETLSKDTAEGNNYKGRAKYCNEAPAKSKQEETMFNDTKQNELNNCHVLETSNLKLVPNKIDHHSENLDKVTKRIDEKGDFIVVTNDCKLVSNKTNRLSKCLDIESQEKHVTGDCIVDATFDFKEVPREIKLSEEDLCIDKKPKATCLVGTKLTPERSKERHRNIFSDYEHLICTNETKQDVSVNADLKSDDGSHLAYSNNCFNKEHGCNMLLERTEYQVDSKISDSGINVNGSYDAISSRKDKAITGFESLPDVKNIENPHRQKGIKFGENVSDEKHVEIQDKAWRNLEQKVDIATEMEGRDSVEFDAKSIDIPEDRTYECCKPKGDTLPFSECKHFEITDTSEGSDKSPEICLNDGKNGTKLKCDSEKHKTQTNVIQDKSVYEEFECDKKTDLNAEPCIEKSENSFIVYICPCGMMDTNHDAVVDHFIDHGGKGTIDVVDVSKDKHSFRGCLPQTEPVANEGTYFDMSSKSKDKVDERCFTGIYKEGRRVAAFNTNEQSDDAITSREDECIISKHVFETKTPSSEVCLVQPSKTESPSSIDTVNERRICISYVTAVKTKPRLNQTHLMESFEIVDPVNETNKTIDDDVLRRTLASGRPMLYSSDILVKDTKVVSNDSQTKTTGKASTKEHVSKDARLRKMRKQTTVDVNDPRTFIPIQVRKKNANSSGLFKNCTELTNTLTQNF